MLAQEVFVQQLGLHGLCVREKSQCLAGEPDQVLEHNRVVDSIVQSPAPGERTVAGDEHAGTVQGIATSKGFDDYIAGVHFVIFFDLASVEPSSARNGPMKIIGVSGAESRNRTATLRPGGGKKAVGVNDATNLTKSAIKNQMSVSIRAGLQIAFDDFSGIQRNDNHVFGFHGGIWNARRFDDNFPAGAVNTADVAPGLDDEAFGDKLEVCGADFFFQSLKHLRQLKQLDLGFFVRKRIGKAGKTAVAPFDGVFVHGWIKRNRVISVVARHAKGILG